MSMITDGLLEDSNRNEKEIINLLKSIDEKLTNLCAIVCKAEENDVD